MCIYDEYSDTDIKKNIGEALYFITNTENRIAKEFDMGDLESMTPDEALMESSGCCGLGVITDNTIKSEYDYIVICENGVQYAKEGEIVEEVYYTDIFKDYLK